MRYISLDIGTTNVKGIIYDEFGRVVETTDRKSTLNQPQPAFREQEASEVLWHARSVIKELVSKIHLEREECGFISLSAYMHSLVLLDENDEALTPIILWNDARAQQYAVQAETNGKGLEIYKRTGTPIHPMSPLYKIIYYREEEPELFARAKRFVSVKEMLLHQMTGEWVVDHAIASATGLFNIHDLDWDPVALEYAGIEASMLSRPLPTTHVIGELNHAFVQEAGLKKSIPVVLGASDGCLANLGSHGLEPGTAVCTIGTSGALRIVSDKPLIDEQARTFSYLLTEDLYVSGGALNNGGIAYEWLRKILAYPEHLDEIFSDKDPSDYGSGLLFLPFLSGDRAPYWDADLRACFIGLSNEHTRDDMLVAGIEGICYALRDVFDVLLEAGDQEVNVVYANGGFTNSNQWLQILTDILERPLRISDQGDGPLFGGFLLGLKAIGIIDSLDEAEEYFASGREFLPRKNHRHGVKFPLYREAVKANQALMHALAAEQVQQEV